METSDSNKPPYYLRIEFNFWNVHGIMNTLGLLQSMCRVCTEMENRIPGLSQDYSRTFFIFQGLIFFDSDTGDTTRDYRTNE